jgi:hypothetical protein
MRVLRNPLPPFAPSGFPWWAHFVVAIVSLGSHTGCTKTCTEPDEQGSVASELAYTEPSAVRDARVAQLSTGRGTAEELKAAGLRGTSRVTEESRAFDRDGLAVDRSSLSLVSTVSFSVTIAGEAVSLPLSVVTVSFDLPPRVGTYSLGDLHAHVCEGFRAVLAADSSADPYQEACGIVSGTISFDALGPSRIDADAAFTANAQSGAPSLVGHAHVHYEASETTSACPDLGSSGQMIGGV